MGSLKLVRVEVVIPRKLTNATNQGVKSTPRASCSTLTVTWLVSGQWDWVLNTDSQAPRVSLLTIKLNLFQKSGKTGWGHSVDILKHVLKVWALGDTLWILQF